MKILSGTSPENIWKKPIRTSFGTLHSRDFHERKSLIRNLYHDARKPHQILPGLDNRTPGNNPPPLVTFNCFPKLPAELQEMIGYEALSTQGVVAVQAPSQKT